MSEKRKGPDAHTSGPEAAAHVTEPTQDNVDSTLSSPSKETYTSSLASIPEQLRALRVWLLWRSEPKPGDTGKARKVPHYANGQPRRGTLDTPEDREQLVTFAEACAQLAANAGRFAGLGVALGLDTDTGLLLSGIDLDDSYDPERGGLSPVARRVVDAAPCCYVEVSPSGRGVKLFGFGDLGTLKTAALEIYSGGRFFTVTGNRLHGDSLVDLSGAAKVARDIAASFEQERGAGGKGTGPVRWRYPDGTRTEALIREAGRLRNISPALSAEQLRDSLLVFNETRCAPPCPERKVTDIARGYMKRDGGPEADSWLCGVQDHRVRELLEKRMPGQVITPGHSVPNRVAAHIVYTEMQAELFIYNGVVSEIVPAGKGSTSLRALTEPQLCSRVERRRGVFAVNASKEGPVLRSTRLPREAATIILSCNDIAAENLRPIQLLIEKPIAVEHEGQLEILRPGYNADAEVFVRGGKPPEDVPLDEAVPALLEAVSQFNFASEADRARAVAGFFSIAMRMGALLPGNAPLLLVEANEPQAGKGYLTELQAAVVGETRRLVPMRDARGVGSLDESIAQASAMGLPIVTLDNFAGPVVSRTLEALMTAGSSTVSLRLPHVGAVEADVSRISYQMTSNGVQLTVDQARRSLVTRIQKQPDGFAWRKYGRGGIREQIIARQPYYYGCVFAVLRRWWDADRPCNPVAHDFHEYVGALDWIAQEVFGLPPLLDGHSGTLERLSNPALVEFRRIALEVERAGKLRQWMHAITLGRIASEDDLEDGAAMEEAQRIGRLAGKCFAKGDTVEFGHLRIKRRSRKDRSKGRLVWFYCVWPAADREPYFSETEDGQEIDA